MKLKNLLLLTTFCTASLASVAQITFPNEFGAERRQLVEVLTTPNHDNRIYKVGEEATVTVHALRAGKPMEGVELTYTCNNEMMKAGKPQTTIFRNGKAVMNIGTMKEPGFRSVEFSFAVDGKQYKDLMKVGFEPENIRTVTECPKDFESYWKKALKEAAKTPFAVEEHAVPEYTDNNYVTTLVKLKVGKNKEMWGYITRPNDNEKHPVLLCVPGAGSSKVKPFDYFAARGFIYMKVEIHGNDPRMPDAEYETYRKEHCDGYTKRNIEDRDKYYYHDVYVGCSRAVDYLCTLPQWDGKNVGVCGGSQGGALTIVTTALNPKVTFCSAFYPALSDLLGFTKERAGGWPKFFTTYNDGKLENIDEEKVKKVLPYYDVANFASLIKVPGYYSYGFNDETCSPTSICASLNNITAPKEIEITPSSGHWRFAETNAQATAWMLAQCGMDFRGKKIAFIGDSYVANHRAPKAEAWHSRMADDLGMTYYNYGRNGSLVSMDCNRFGPAVYKRYLDMPEDLDYVVVIAGHNDASRMDEVGGLDKYREKLIVLLDGLKARYPKAKIMWYTCWRRANFEGSICQQLIDATKEECNKRNIPIFDTARDSYIKADDAKFRAKYFQGPDDTAHLNAAGHALFMPQAVQFFIRNAK